MAGVQRRENKRSDLNSFWKVTSWEKRKTEQQGREQKEKHTHKPLTSTNRAKQVGFQSCAFLPEYFSGEST